MSTINVEGQGKRELKVDERGSLSLNVTRSDEDWKLYTDLYYKK